LEEFREEGEAIARSIAKELQQIHSRNELIASSGRLQSLFNSLVKVAIAARNFQELHPRSSLPKGDLTTSDQMRAELNRIYQIDGCREILEKCQEEALHSLDAFEKSHSHKILNSK
jgi:hypothetical protein